MLNKKAIGAAQLVMIIIIILGFFIVAKVVFEALSKSGDSKAEGLCKTSVAFAASSVVKSGSSGVSLGKVLCKTIDKKVSEDPDVVKKLLADKMAKCWEMFGEGRNPNSVFDALPFFGGDNKCFICYTILLEESRNFKEDKHKISVEEFGNYLATTDYKIKDRSYLDYIQSSGGPGNIFTLLDPDKGIKPNNGYAIAYKAKASECKVCEELAGGGAGAAGLGAASLWAFGVGTGGVGFVVAGLGALGYGAYTLAAETGIIVKKRVLKLDSILLVDMGNKQLWDQFSDECTLQADITGR